MKRRDALKERIKRKFGSYSEFARLAGIDRYELQLRFLTSPRPDDEWFLIVENFVKVLKPELKFELLSKDKLRWIKGAIIQRGGVIKFCKDSGFSKNTIFHIIGKYKPGEHKGQKLVTPMVNKLIEYLEQSENKSDSIMK